MQFRILHYNSLTSTNDYAKSLCAKGVQEGIVVFSDYQTRGRGRFERRWRSPKGKDLLFSIILRPYHLKANQIPILTQIAARSVQGVIDQTLRIRCTIKKPNDILIQGKKVCGILVEGSTTGKQNGADYVIVGVGLNVNSERRQLLKRATSLYEVTGRKHDRNELLKILLIAFRNSMRQLKEKV